MAEAEAKKPKLAKEDEDAKENDVLGQIPGPVAADVNANANPNPIPMELNDNFEPANQHNDHEDPDVFNGEYVGIKVDYKVKTADDILKDMQQIVRNTCEVIDLSEDVTLILLNHVKWNADRLYEGYFGNEENFLKNANVIVVPISSYNLDSVYCEICFELVSHCQSSTMNCGHLFCKNCWRDYLETQIMNEGSSQTITCPGSGCPVFVEYNMVLALVTDPTVMKKYKLLTTKHFVDSSRRFRWCPGADCPNAVFAELPKWGAVTCSCGTCFCFLCGKDWHEPINCEMLVLWEKKCIDDSETSTWMQANTKDCPKCQTMIEKSGGCNHMTCRNKTCNHQFCWICMGDWDCHTGDAYNCNRFDEAKLKDASEARTSLKRYLHYYDRYMSHKQSLKFETKLKDTVNSKMDIFQREMKMSWVDVQFFPKAAGILCKCRKALMNTYSFAFFLNKSNQSDIFEANQRDLERAAESLSGLLENDFFKDGDDNRAEFNPNEIKRKVVDGSAYCESRRIILIAHVLEGYDEGSWSYLEGAS